MGGHVSERSGVRVIIFIPNLIYLYYALPGIAGTKF